MRHDHIVVTLDAWVADAIESKLEGGDETGKDGVDRDGDGHDGATPEYEYEYDHVDDCGI